MTIEEFINQRIADEERIAEATSGTATEREWVYAEGRVSDTGEYRGLHAEAHDPRDGVHIARHDPARVLRQCEAIRTLVAYHDGGVCGFGENGECLHCNLLPIIAAIWSDHSDYRQEWKP